MLFDSLPHDLLTLKEASEWASGHLQKNVTTANIAYLVNYAKIRKFTNQNKLLVSKCDLISYYESFYGKREIHWKNQLGDDLNWALSFDYLKEAETTKHVHRLHPYKGKFIPQLVEYFLDNHVDEFKTQIYFQPGDIVLDPFCGSGTTLVQANELGMHAIGIDISAFNSLICNVKVTRYPLAEVRQALDRITQALKLFISKTRIHEFESHLAALLKDFNDLHFPSPEYKHKIKKGEIDETSYGAEKEQEFLTTYQQLVQRYQITLLQQKCENFLDQWYLEPIRQEIDFIFSLIKEIANKPVKKLLAVILSRTIRSCRATTHADLATLKSPVTATYYCAKHGKVCKPLFSMLSWWERYCQDTLQRLSQFERLRTDTWQICLTGDARQLNLFEILQEKQPKFAEQVLKQKIKGIFSSPPYVGLIDYHEQHAYAYDLFGFDRNDGLEIGALRRGQGKEARQDYVEAIAAVLNHNKQYLADNYDVFLVANDKYNLYATIAEKAKMQIVNQFKRPVLNRSEKDKSAYAEIIFHLKEA
jgi:hypothetical protein